MRFYKCCERKLKENENEHCKTHAKLSVPSAMRLSNMLCVVRVITTELRTKFCERKMKGNENEQQKPCKIVGLFSN